MIIVKDPVYVGNVYRVYGLFKNPITGAIVFPDTVYVNAKNGTTGVVVAYTYPASASKETATGRYYADVPLTDPLVWIFEWHATGAGQAVSEPLTLTVLAASV